MKQEGEKAVLLAAIHMLIAPCGYAPPRSEAPEGIRTIAVETFTTRVAHVAVGSWVAEAVRREILVARSLRLAPGSRADATLRGEVLAIDDGVTALGTGDSGPVAALSGAAIVVRLRLIRRDGEVVADLGEIRARAVRSVSRFADDDTARSDRALRDAAQELGRRIVRVLLEGP
ncbi:MAG: hypothetical protein HYY06_00310 [Deltaproteobacteria bacterium]|nr:hypothetical protein [Deltaproteobacteria bacterium]